MISAVATKEDSLDRVSDVLIDVVDFAARRCSNMRSDHHLSEQTGQLVPFVRPAASAPMLPHDPCSADDTLEHASCVPRRAAHTGTINVALCCERDSLGC